MGRDCASERGQRLELGRLRGTLRRCRVLEERALPSPGQFAEGFGGPGGTGKAGTQRRVTSIGPMVRLRRECRSVRESVAADGHDHRTQRAAASGTGKVLCRSARGNVPSGCDDRGISRLCAVPPGTPAAGCASVTKGLKTTSAPLGWKSLWAQNCLARIRHAYPWLREVG
jgi:hypothetical protein